MRRVANSLGLLLMVGAVVLPPPVDAQPCNWDGAPDCNPATAPYEGCTRMVATGIMCQVPTNNGNGTVCGPNTTATMIYTFIATQTNTAQRPSAYCNWNCTMGTRVCRIELIDGLPVELLEFGTAESTADAGEAEELVDRTLE